MAQRETEKSYLISALRQQKQNKNYVISRHDDSRSAKQEGESYLDRWRKPMPLSFILVLESTERKGRETLWTSLDWNHPHNGTTSY